MKIPGPMTGADLPGGQQLPGIRRAEARPGSNWFA
jgi:hypothetical protein